ncbi:hypothetical protein BH23BAC1_BH23BAC1_24140 [soil metagenome]
MLPKENILNFITFNCFSAYYVKNILGKHIQYGVLSKINSRLKAGYLFIFFQGLHRIVYYGLHKFVEACQ